MTYQLKISKQKQVTLPVALLKQLGLTGGDYLYIKPNEDDFVIINNKVKIQKLAGSLGRKIKDKSKLLKTNKEFELALEKSKINSFKNWAV
jgi:bifunctional DNA-binding transcriptional regulator/antitoxin component of YhaV-PrlF toxin-antitoxin module